MPRYAYKCNLCLEEMTLFHLVNEEPPLCPKCRTPGTLTKLLSIFTTKRKEIGAQKVGKITEEFIQTAAAELKEQKKSMEEER
jgi:putative FmdB family regulatory protein